MTSKNNEKVHFIAIGGSVMHSLAIALKLKGLEVSGSDDAIYEPSKQRLINHGLYPATMGWDESRITPRSRCCNFGNARPGRQSRTEKSQGAEHSHIFIS
ncbi:MAG: Mur ligase domain-containing protein [Cyclobacteriaceae bacterium]|nr:Mur ligase domain-containing protein [Cyclobacteriaceae bacterium]